jgi:hypothetical protein
MNIGFLLLCDRAEALNGKLYTLGGGWNTLRFGELPATFPFSIGLAIDVPWDATNQRHELRIHVEGPDGERLGDPFEVEFEAGRPPGAIPGQDQRMVIALGAQHVFETIGPHAAVVSIDGDERARARFQVIREEAEASELDSV